MTIAAAKPFGQRSNSGGEAFECVLHALLVAFADAIGRVSDDTFAALQSALSDEEIFELTYGRAMYLQHAVITRALRLEWDDRPEPVVEVAPPEEFDAEQYVAVGSTHEAKEQLRDLRR